MRRLALAFSKQSRRDFLKKSTAVLTVFENRMPITVQTAPSISPSPVESRLSSKVANKKFVAIQVGAVSFVDEGVDHVLDILQERAHVNTLMLAVFTYGRGIAGRQLPGQPLPDHGAQQYDTETFHGGSYTDIHPEYYMKTALKNFRAPDLGNFDLLTTVVPKARARGMQSYCWLEDVYNPQFLPGFETMAEIDIYGRRTDQACLSHPEIRDFLKSLVEDYIKSHKIDGIMWGSERQGPFNHAIGAHHGEFDGPAPLTCFCQYCRKRGQDRGVSVERAQQGLMELDRFVQVARSGQRPSDGYFVSFWRLLLNYPEILAWEKLWTDSQQEVYGEIYGTVKSINPQVQVGWHIWHNNSFNPFYRAEQDYSKLRQNSDYLKVVMYNNCGGPRMGEFLRNIHTSIFRDAKPEETLPLYYKIMGYEGEASFEKLATAGLSPEYVARETKRAVAGVHSEIPIYPGIDIDIPTEKGEKKTQPSDVRAAVKAALTAGASGVVLSRKYSEMRLANLSAAGEALKELGI